VLRCTIQLDGQWMARSNRSPGAVVKPADSEKITINVGYVDLGHIDLLVREGFYANRTDLIRTAIRNQIASHSETLRQTVSRRSLVLGIHHFSRKDLEAARERGEKLQIQVLGLASIADDVSPALAAKTIESIVVLGTLQASQGVKRALAGRIK
jgi:Arc/MetJ-type ribon-helix-helix transcriptional regulator